MVMMWQFKVHGMLLMEGNVFHILQFKVESVYNTTIGKSVSLHTQQRGLPVCSPYV